MHVSIKNLINNGKINDIYFVKGWVRTKRGNNQITFLSINDGSCYDSIQVVSENKIDTNDIHTGTSVRIEGKLIESQGKGQKFDLVADKIEIIGYCDPESYPIQPKSHSFEFLREKGHLRFRTKTFSSIFRIRHAISFAIHKFFHEKNFYYLHTPILTTSDAEGAGEMFRATTLEKNKIDASKDFFAKDTFLTVSGQLEAELGALGLGKVYTFGPTFRAENSNTSRHLAEFWMIEPEVAFASLDDVINLAIEMIKYVIKFVTDNYFEDMKFLNDRLLKEQSQLKKEERDDKTLIDKLNYVVNEPFEIIDYTDAFNILKNSKPNKKRKFKFLINDWGVDFQSEHERFLVEKKFKKPVVIINYPKQIKAFYMRRNDDNKTVAAMDILMPGIGEVIGGSQREERLNILNDRMLEMNISKKELWWYLETRKFGTVPHGGFGLGLERLVQFITGMRNIRDVIPFPRTPKNIEF